MTYKEFFEKKLAAYGVESLNDIPKDKLDNFFNEIDLEWTSQKEKATGAIASLKIGETIEITKT